MTDYIGSKISLISKAGIRYEGILYTIDPVEFTVALSKVKSFGTEDRKVERQIAPREEIYEYIIFRGSDIADLSVCETNKEMTLLSEDSAIVIASETNAISPHVIQNNEESWKKKNSMNASKPNDNESISKNISPIGTKSSNFNGDIKNQRKNDKLTSNYSNENKHDRNKPKYDRNPKMYDRYQDYYDYGFEENYKNIGFRQSNDYYYSNKSRPNSQKSNNFNGRRGGYDSHYNHYNTNSYSDSNNKLRGFASSDNNGGNPGHHYYDYRPSRQSNNTQENNKPQGNKNRRKPATKTEVPVTKKESYKEDYDFESANAIIAKELENLTLNQEKKEVKETAENYEKEDGEVSECSDTAFYDKTKSFFDNISSEVIDRANGKTVRPMNRKEERKMNVETFGVAESLNTNKKDRIRSSGSGNGGHRWSRGGGGYNYRYSNNRRPNTNPAHSYLSNVTNNNKRGGGQANFRRPVQAV